MDDPAALTIERSSVRNASASPFDLRPHLPSNSQRAPLVAADRLWLPVITFPEGAALADVTTAVLDALLEAQGQRLQRVFDIHQRFTRIILAGGGAAEVASTLHTLLECPVAIVDASGRPALVAPSDAAGVLDMTTASGVRQPIVGGDHQTARSSPSRTAHPSDGACS